MKKFIGAWVCNLMLMKLIYCTLASRISIWSIISSVVYAFGVLWLLVEIVSYFFPHLIPKVQEFWWIFLVVGVCVGIYRGWPRLMVRSVIAGTDSGMEIRVGDLFQQDGAVVVAAPTSFDTSLEDGTIDERSIQGQYTKRYCDSLENLNRQIEASLKGVRFEIRDEVDKPYGSRRQYPVGTVAPISFKGKQAYFVEIATLNEHKNAFLTRDELLDALPALWENIRRRGNMSPIDIPIIESGFSRLNATREELIREIVKSFVAATHAGKFCEQLRIVISTKDFRERKVNLEILGRFLEHECMYGNVQKISSPPRVGTSAQ